MAELNVSGRMLKLGSGLAGVAFAVLLVLEGTDFWPTVGWTLLVLMAIMDFF